MSDDTKKAEAKKRAAKIQQVKKEKAARLHAIAEEHRLHHMNEDVLALMIASAQQVAKAKKKSERTTDLSYVRQKCRQHGFTATNLKGYLVVRAKKRPKDMYAHFKEELQKLESKHYSELKRAIAAVDEEKSKAGKAA